MKDSELCLLSGMIYLAPHLPPVFAGVVGALFCFAAIVFRGMGK